MFANCKNTGQSKAKGWQLQKHWTDISVIIFNLIHDICKLLFLLVMAVEVAKARTF